MKHFLLFCFYIISVNAISQTELDPVIITASLQQTKISETGRDIIVLKGEQFNKLPVHSLDELLRYVPGIEIQQRGPQGTQSDILIRGGTFQQVLVIIDGIRLNDPLTGHFNSYIPVTPSEIDRIEIVKGASSAIYGSDAVGGVIHIITRTFSEKQQLTSFSAGLTGGEKELINIGAGGFYQHKRFSLSGGLLSNNAKGEQQRGINGYFHNTTLSAALRYGYNNWMIGIRISVDRRNFAAQNFYTSFTSDTATEKVNTWWNHVKITYRKNKNSFSFDAGYKKVRDEYLFNRNAAPNLNHSSVIQSLAIYGKDLSASSKLKIGTQFTGRTIRSNDRGTHMVHSLAGFIILNHQMGKRFHLSPAIRFEKVFIPQVSLSYRANKLLLRASGGRTIREADFTEQFNNYGKTLVTSGNIGNPDLVAESSWTFETGADYFASSYFKFSSTFFVKYYSGLIDWINTPYANMPRKDNLSPAGNYFLARNISSLTTSGIETSMQYQSKMLQGSIGLTILNSSAITSLYISSHARVLLTGSIFYQYRFLQFSVNGLYKQRQGQTGNASLVALDKEYVVLNSKLSALVKNISVFMQCNNVTDAMFADRFGVPMPGRWISAGVAAVF